jgi:hypothetical protein
VWIDDVASQGDSTIKQGIESPPGFPDTRTQKKPSPDPVGDLQSSLIIPAILRNLAIQDTVNIRQSAYALDSS